MAVQLNGGATDRGRSRPAPSGWVCAGLLLALVMTACSPSAPEGGDTTTADGGTAGTSGEATSDPAAGPSDDTLVPPIRFLGPTAAYEEALFESNNLMLENWRELGLQVEETLLAEVTEILDAAGPREYEAVSFGYGGRIDRVDPNELISRPFLCEFAGPNGSNYSDYCREEYDEVAVAQKSAVDEEERRELVHRAQELQALDVPWVTHYYPSEIYAYNAEAYGDVIPGFTVGLQNWHNIMYAEPLTEDRTFRMGSDSVMRAINPMDDESYQSDVEMERLIFDTLAKIQPDGTVGPHLAEDWEFVDDTTLVVNIRPGVKFHDGEDLTADDVKFSYDYFKEWDIGLYVDPLSEIESVEVVDPDTVQLNLTGPSATVLFNALSSILILPQHIWESVVEDEGLGHPSEWTETNMIGSGPFAVDTIAPGEAVDFVRNDDFWGEPAKSERFIDIFFGDSQGVMRALQDGTIYFHHAGALPPDSLQQVIDGQVPGVVTGEVGSTTTRGVAFRMSEGSPFRDYHLRLAVAHTIDKQFAVDVGNRGFADAGAGTIAPDNVTWYNDAVPQEELDEGTPHWTQLDMEQARAILEEAGYTWDDQGRLHYPSADYEPQVLHDDE